METPENPQGSTSGPDPAPRGVGGALGNQATTSSSTEWESVTRRYKRSLGGPWLLALVGVPAILAAVGLGLGGDDDGDTKAGGSTPSVTQSSTPSVSPTDAGNASSTPWSLTRVGNDVTVKGVVPDDAAKTSVVADVKSKLPGVTVIDELTVTSGAAAAPRAALGALADAAGQGGDFSFDFDGSALTLTGAAVSQDAKAAAESAAKAAFPNATIDNQLTVGASVSPTPSPTASPSATAGGTAACSTLGADITAILGNAKIVFVNNGTAITPASQTTVKAVAAKWKGCTTAKLAVTGYTSSTGSAALNTRLSTGRADAVKAALVANGVTSGSITAVGRGPASPIASNATEAGREANRRVEITVG